MVADTLLVLDNLYNRATVIANVEVAENMTRAQLESLYRGAEAKIGEWLERLGQRPPSGRFTCRLKLRFQRRLHPTKTGNSRTESGGSRNTSRRATPFRPSFPAGWI